jgi:hypothetical protein
MLQQPVIFINFFTFAYDVYVLVLIDEMVAECTLVFSLLQTGLICTL